MAEKTLAQRIRNAVKTDDFETFVQLVNDDISQLNALTPPFGSWLHVAASFGRLDMVRYLIGLGADTSLNGGILGGNPLNLAASKGHLDVVLALLENGAAMDVSAPERNPLFGAICEGNKDIVEILVRYGIDYQARYTSERMNNMSAIEFAQELRQTEILIFLESLD